MRHIYSFTCNKFTLITCRDAESVQVNTGSGKADLNSINNRSSKENFTGRKKAAALTVVVLLLAVFTEAWSQTVVNFTATNTWTCPAGLTYATVQCWGGGGAGGGAIGGIGVGGGGGAGGAYAGKIVALTPGTAYPVTVGARVAGVTGNGLPGNPSWFNTVSTVFAEGGQGGTGATVAGSGNGGNGSGALSIGDIIYAGGNGAKAISSAYSGAGGGGAGSTGAGGNASGSTAGTGTPLSGGNGGAGIVNLNAPGLTGTAAGGGGSGAYRISANRRGGNGARGLITISYFTLNSTAATSSLCKGNSSTVTIRSGRLPVGSYTVTYNLAGANIATGLTATATVSAAGTGTFITTALVNAGSTTLTITNLAADSKFCSSSIASNNTATIITVEPFENVSAPSAQEGDTQSILTWTNPVACYDEIMIVAKEAGSITASPSGDGSAYTANLVYGSGTGFDGGYVVYRGVTSPQTVSGLSNGTTYYFKFFTRQGTNWSSGIETSTTAVTPGAGDYRSVASGNWSNLATWQFFNGTSWATPTAGQGVPTITSGKITIQSGTSVRVNSTMYIDELIINNGGAMDFASNITLTIADDPGVDLINNGTITVNGRSTGPNYLNVDGQLENNGSIGVTMNTNTGSVNIANGATLICSATSTISGAGDFSLMSGATIEIGSLNGIAALGNNTGNIRTTNIRDFSAGANYIYNGAGSQVTGSGLPQTAISGEITISEGASVTATNSIIADGTLTVNGTFIPGAASQTFGGTGTLTGTGILKISRAGTAGDFSNQYTISTKTLTNLSIEYAGTASQLIATDEFPGNATNSITSNNSTGVTLGTDFTLTSLTINPASKFIIGAPNTLTVTNITNNGGNSGLVIKSAGNGNDGKLINSTSAVPATVELALSGGAGSLGPAFHYFVPPVESMSIEPTTISGTSAALGLTNFNGDLLSYDEPEAIINKNDGWQYFDGYGGSSGFSSLTSSNGYNIYLTASDIITFTGELNSSDHSFSLDYTGTNPAPGWNLVGNPFPSNYDLNGISALTTTGDAVDNTVYFNNDGGYTYWNVETNVGSSGYSDILPPMQGFFVITTASTSLSLPASFKTGSAALPVRSKGSTDSDGDSKNTNVDPIKKIKLVLNNGTARDEAIVCMIKDATTGYDGDYDAYKLFANNATSPSIYTELNGIKYAINSLPEPGQTKSIIPVTVIIKTPGTYKINITEFENIGDVKIILKHGTVETILNQDASYTFTSAAGTFTDFELIIGETNTPTGVEKIVKGKFRTWYNNELLYINSPDQLSSDLCILEIMDMQGRPVYTNNKMSLIAGETIQVPVSLSNGMYVIIIKSGGQPFISKIVVF